MSNWIKASEDMPDVERLVVVRSLTRNYDNELQPVDSWEYNAGIVEKAKWGIFIPVAYCEYKEPIDKDDEWQYLEE